MADCSFPAVSRRSADIWDDIGVGRATDVVVQQVVDPFSGGPCWAVTGRDAIDYVSRHPHLYSSSERSAMPEEYSDSALGILRNQLINMDPPRHRAHRAILTRYFSEQAQARYRPEIERFAHQAVDAMLADDHCEFVAQIATALPFMTILHILGLPLDDRCRLAALVQQVLFAGQGKEAAAASSELYLYALQQLHACRGGAAVPGSLMEAIVHATVDGKPLRDAEIISMLVFMLIAGTSSTRATISHGMRLFIEHPDQYRLIAEQPELIPDAVEEILRHAPAFMCMRRTALWDTVLAGVRITKGDKLLLFYRLAHFSTELFGAHARAFDITRGEPGCRNAHRAFGTGQHFCLGNGIARLELVALFSALACKLSAPRLLSPPVFSHSLHLDDIHSMHIQYLRQPHEST